MIFDTLRSFKYNSNDFLNSYIISDHNYSFKKYNSNIENFLKIMIFGKKS